MSWFYRSRFLVSIVIILAYIVVVRVFVHFRSYLGLVRHNSASLVKLFFKVLAWQTAFSRKLNFFLPHLAKQLHMGHQMNKMTIMPFVFSNFVIFFVQRLGAKCKGARSIRPAAALPVAKCLPKMEGSAHDDGEQRRYIMPLLTTSLTSTTRAMSSSILWMVMINLIMALDPLSSLTLSTLDIIDMITTDNNHQRFVGSAKLPL